MFYFIFAPKVQFHYAGVSREFRFSRKFSTYNNSSKTTAFKYTINLVSNYCVRNQDILYFTCRVGQIRLKPLLNFNTVYTVRKYKYIVTFVQVSCKPEDLRREAY